MDGGNWIALASVVVAVLAVIIGIVLGVRSEREVRRAGDAAEASAKASELSASAATEANRFQREQWEASKRADLYLLRAKTLCPVPDHLIPRMAFTFRNVGSCPAFDINVAYNPPIPMYVDHEMSKLPSAIHTQSEAVLVLLPKYGPPLDNMGNRQTSITITYRDGNGPHCLEATFDFEFQGEADNDMVLRSAFLDGDRHHQHPKEASVAGASDHQ